MSQLPTSPFPKRGTSGPGNVFSTLCWQANRGRRHLWSNWSPKGVTKVLKLWTVSFALCDGECLWKRLSPRPSKPLKCSNRNYSVSYYRFTRHVSLYIYTFYNELKTSKFGVSLLILIKDRNIHIYMYIYIHIYIYMSERTLIGHWGTLCQRRHS